ncbi:DNA primase [Naasia lichenicola]|uniref:DNA primase n=1 Tax=Naasia lichenicola TaxID=2565933 RepID=A0A4S4FDG3_9MICO|nr:DNA primase [Naasia lichenicola]THG28139.1 DNA primase [Naasia lichenicola]
MAGLIRKSDIDEVRARTNLADIVGDFVSLKTAGVGSMKGLCPFHDERSPSFHVRPQVGLFHCFGCGEGGDVYTFLQKIDHVTFAEAVERLAGRLGYPLHYEDGGPAQESGNRARLLAANRAAGEFFVERLGSADADIGRRFLGERAFDRAAASHFGVGYAPKSWDELTKHLRGRGFTDAELTAAGLVSSGDRGVYDRFRGRVVWPIRDLSGETVGFGARRLFDDDKGPKYLNTPETPVYHKAQVLYGLDLAKRDISRGRQVVVVEGYTDVMACHLAGITTAVATCGTSFGVDHIKILRRVLGDDSAAGEVIFTFDPDAAGQKAAVRAFGEEQRFAAQTYVAAGPEGLDPCDLRLSRGDEAVRLMIEAKKPMFEFILRQRLSQHDLDTVEGRVAALRSAAPVVAEIRDPSLRPGYARELARMLGVDLGEVNAAVRAVPATRDAASSSGPRSGSSPRDDSRSAQVRPADSRDQGRSGPPSRSAPSGPPQGGPDRRSPSQTAPQQRGQQDGQQRPAQSGTPRAQRADSSYGPPDSEHPPYDRYEAPAAAEPEAPIVGPGITQLPGDPSTRLERDALMAALQFPNQIGRPLLERALASAFANRDLAAVRDGIASSLDAASSPAWLQSVTDAVPPQLANLVQQLAVASIPTRQGDEAVQRYVREVASKVVERDVQRRERELRGQLQRAGSGQDPDRYREIQRGLVALEMERRALREQWS